MISDAGKFSILFTQDSQRTNNPTFDKSVQENVAIKQFVINISGSESDSESELQIETKKT